LVLHRAYYGSTTLNMDAARYSKTSVNKNRKEFIYIYIYISEDLNHRQACRPMFASEGRLYIIKLQVFNLLMSIHDR